jgi:UDP-3-O-[3-hydroxymyristoyl] glucosamine N-acyltransferase
MKLSELADQTGARVEGTDVDITGAAGLDEASEGHITFLAIRNTHQSKHHERVCYLPCRRRKN